LDGGSSTGGFEGTSPGSFTGGFWGTGGSSGGSPGSLTGGFLGALGGSSTGALFDNRPLTLKHESVRRVKPAMSIIVLLWISTMEPPLVSIECREKFIRF
jgi:hypothetical protein